MTVAHRPASQEAGFVFFFPLLAAVLVFAPLIMAGNRPLPLLVLELAALALLVGLAVRPSFAGHLSRTMLVALAGLALLPLLYLLPLPESLWSVLPGRDFYSNALASAGMDAGGGLKPASLVPRSTEFAALALLPPLAVFLTTVGMPDRKLKVLVHLFIGIAVIQALVGLAQFGTGSAWVVFSGPDEVRVDSARGTYANRDHLAGLLEMALPLTLALLAANFQLGDGRGRPRQHRSRHLGKRLANYFAHEFTFNRTVLFASASIAILLGLIFTRSRTGVALAMLAILLCALFFSRRLGGDRSVGLVSVFSVVGLALAIEVGLAPVLQRFTDQSVAADSRWSIFQGTLKGIGEFFPLGSGIGTFPEIFRRFQPGDVPLFVNHAHNDYLEWLFEGGMLAGMLIVVFLVLYIARWRGVWSQDEHWSNLRFAQIAAGIGLLLMGLHSFVDFNLHIPANAIYFAFLAGVFFHREEKTHHAEKTAKHRTEEVKQKQPDIAPTSQPDVTADSNWNPFKD